MKSFVYYTPTEVVFGKGSESKVGNLVKQFGGKKVLLHYGGKSAVRSGLLDRVCGALDAEGVKYVKLGGVVPNPRLSKVYDGIELCRKEGVDLILAVGGGSVIDSAKAIGLGLMYDGDVWDFFAGKAKAESGFPVGVVLTIPAAGSEMSCSCVITKEDGAEKRSYDDDIIRPKFAVMDPELTYSLPAYQTACGVVDIMMHTMERYFSHEDDMTLTDEVAEAILRTVKDCAYNVLKNPGDYRCRAQIMWAGSLSHNGLTGCGTVGDFASHRLEHELSALYDVAHGAGLAAVWATWARYVFKENVSRFVRFAVNVMGVTNDFTDPEATALAGIEAMERFYRDLSMPTSISELIGREPTDAEIKLMAEKCSRGGVRTVGHFKELDMADMEAIYRLAR